MSKPPLLRVHLDAGYSGKPVLHDICFELQSGQVLGLVGSSGAGKSTLVLSLLGLLPWRGGRVTGEVVLEGENPVRPQDCVHSAKPYDRAQLRDQFAASFPGSLECPQPRGARSARCTCKRITCRSAAAMRHRVSAPASGADQRWAGATRPDRACSIAPSGAHYCR